MYGNNNVRASKSQSNIDIVRVTYIVLQHIYEELVQCSMMSYFSVDNTTVAVRNVNGTNVYTVFIHRK